jgi:hypothetical protein
MSYTLTPVLVDLAQLAALLGSKDVKLLQSVIKKHRREMLETDALGNDYDDFEGEIKAEYKAFAAGDFSSVDLNRVYDDPPEDAGEEVDVTDFVNDMKDLDASDPQAMQDFLEKHGGFLEDFFSDEEEDEGENHDEIVREPTTGAALAHLILGGNPDRRFGYKYGFALRCLCQHLGRVAPNNSWCTIRSAAFDAVDAALSKAGVSAEAFSTAGFLVNRGAPVPIPAPADFPFIGYVTREEASRLLPLLDPVKTEAAIRGAPNEVQEWLGGALSELRAWLDAAVKSDRDLVCFYI